MIDKFLNKVTMYRLTLYYLIGLVGIAALFGGLGLLPYTPADIIISAIVAVISSYLANYCFAWFFKAVTNSESVFITALILTLIIPVKLPHSLPFIIGASILAMGVKYLVTVEKRHIFNPAAAAIAGIALLSPEYSATWWIGTPSMMPFVLIGGLAIVRKTRREDLVTTFLATYALVVAIFAFLHTGSALSILSILEKGIRQSALFFFAFVMLVEPLTSPPTKTLQRYFGGLVALLYSTPQVRLFGIVFTPETALCIGNIYSFLVSPQYRLVLALSERIQMTKDTFVFIFSRVNKFSFVPGQYMEWTLPHRDVDSRGNRRYFSLASSPTEASPMLTVKFNNPSSSYKKALLSMEKGDEIIASQLAGDFVLPKEYKKPLAFIAGGVGVAPFRSMIQYIIDNKLSVNIVLLFANRHMDDVIFADIFARAREYGIKTYYTLTDTTSIPPVWRGFTGHITSWMVQEAIPDFEKRTFYISGPQLMVQETEKILKQMHIEKAKIMTDFFPGYKETK